MPNNNALKTIFDINFLIIMLTERKMHNLQVAHYVLFGKLLSTTAWEAASQTALRNCSEEVREEPGYTEVFCQGEWGLGGGGNKTCSQTSKDYG